MEITGKVKGCLENNRIYNENCLLGMKLIPDKSIDLIVTDPPYRLTARGNCGNMSGYWAEEESLKGKVFQYNSIDIAEYIEELYRVLKDGTHCYIMCNNLNLPHFIKVINESKFKFIKCLIWDKCNKLCGHYYMNSYEYIIMLRKGVARKINNCGESDILRVPNKKTKGLDGKNIHNSEKPVALMQILIENSSLENDNVLDPFMGSGTTAIAAIRSKRNFIGFELSEEYWKIANERCSVEKCVAEYTLF